jgi:hypothetical protein
VAHIEICVYIFCKILLIISSCSCLFFSFFLSFLQLLISQLLFLNASLQYNLGFQHLGSWKLWNNLILFRSPLYRSIIWTIFWNYPNTWLFLCIFSNGYSTIHHMVKKSSFNTNRRSYSSPKILLTKCSDFHWALSLLLCIAEIIIDVEQLHAQYLQGRKTIPVKVLVSMLLISCNY